MKIFACVLLAVLMFASVGHAAGIGTTAPDFTLSDINAKPYTLAQFRGKVVLLGFWAPWCDQCREELGAFDDLYRKYRGDGLEIIAVDIENSSSRLADVMQKLPVAFTVLLDSKDVGRKYYRVRTLPTVFMIGRDGVTRSVHYGFGKDQVQMYEKEIGDLLKQQ